MYLAYIRTSFLLMSLLVSAAFAQTVDEEIYRLISDEQALSEGKKTFETNCLACHGKDLSGGNGFNLKDGEWVHGSKPSQILNNVNNGFLNAGMPSFKDILSIEKKKQVIAYVLSKREGFENLTYKIYPLDKASSKQWPTFEGQTPLKQGKLHNNLMDFNLPEISSYAIVFEGDFYTYKNKLTSIWLQAPQGTAASLQIDGGPVQKKTRSSLWRLKKGKQHLKYTYYAFKKPRVNDFMVLVVGKTKQLKYFPISTKGKTLMEGRDHVINVENTDVVQRKKLDNLPVNSIAVGLPNKINYAFGTEECAINSLWYDAFLDIGPNVHNRTGDPSLLLGKLYFNAPQQLSMTVKQGNTTFDKASCDYQAYDRGNNTIFYYQIGGIDFSMYATTNTKKQISFHYQVLSSLKAKTSLIIDLPQSPFIKYTSDNGQINNNKLMVKLKNKQQFSVQLSLLEKK